MIEWVVVKGWEEELGEAFDQQARRDKAQRHCRSSPRPDPKGGADLQGDDDRVGGGEGLGGRTGQARHWPAGYMGGEQISCVPTYHRKRKCSNAPLSVSHIP